MSQASKLTLTGDILAAVTTGAELAIWDLADASCLVKPLCFRGLLAQGGELLTSKNLILIQASFDVNGGHYQ